MRFGPEKMVFLDYVHIWLLCTVKLFYVFVDATVKCVHRLFLSPCNNFHDRVMPVFNPALPQSQKIVNVQH